MFQGSFVRRSMFLFMLFLLPVPAFAVSTLSVVPAGNGVFILQGDGLSNVAGIDVAISYDSSLLTNPRMAQGSLVSGAMTAANVNTPGIFLLSVIGNQAIKGSGTIATITFDRIGDTQGKITSLKGSIIDGEGKSLPLALNMFNPSDPVVATAQDAPQETAPMGDQATDQPATQGAGTSAHPAVLGGSVTLPADELEKKGEEKVPFVQPENQESVVLTREAAAPAPAEAPKAEKKEVPAPQPIQSVLELFRLFQGERTVKNLTALFAPRADAPFKQEPPVFIADGKGTVKVTIFRVPGDRAPNFSFNSASAVSLTVAGGDWVVEAKPDKDALSASIALLMDGQIQELPLVVSPAAEVDLDKSGKVTEADFLLFLKERGTAAAPKFDLNKDGKRDYLDDYIFTANYLASGKKGSDR